MNKPFKVFLVFLFLSVLEASYVGATYDSGNLEIQVVIVVDEKAANTAGGTFTSGAWQTRTLNTFRVNDDTIASLSSDQVTLPAGTYECWISALANDVNRHKIRLQNITAVSTIAVGSSEYASSANDVSTISYLYHKFTISVSSALEVQHRCQTTRSTDGFGLPSNFGVVEVYTIAMFRKVG